MQTIVHEIFEAYGGATAIHRATGVPVQTVHDWIKKGKPEIPPWRRSALLAATPTKPLSEQAIAYLRSNERGVA